LFYTCTSSYTGTSASAPMAAGVIALVLQVGPIVLHLHLVPYRHLRIRPHGGRGHRSSPSGGRHCFIPACSPTQAPLHLPPWRQGHRSSPSGVPFFYYCSACAPNGGRGHRSSPSGGSHCSTPAPRPQGFGSGSGSAWIRINLSCWIRIRI
jgi:hypothetical protein